MIIEMRVFSALNLCEEYLFRSDYNIFLDSFKKSFHLEIVDASLSNF